VSNFIYYEKLEDYEEQVKKAKLCDEKDKEIERLNNIINTFDTFIEEVYNHINLGDESDDFMLVLNKWLELKGSDKE